MTFFLNRQLEKFVYEKFSSLSDSFVKSGNGEMTNVFRVKLPPTIQSTTARKLHPSLGCWARNIQQKIVNSDFKFLLA